MAFTSPNMSLRIWNLLSDAYNHTEQANNWAEVDAHDHSPGKGVLIGTAGLAPGAVTSAQLASPLTIGALTVTGNETVGGNLAVTGNEIVTGNLTVTGNELVSGTLGVSGVAGFGTTVNVNGLLNANASLTEPITGLPASPVDGQIWNYGADPSNGVVWRLRYNASSASTYKWEFVGGSDLMVSNNTFVSLTPLTSGTALTSSVTLPRAGDYDVIMGSQMSAQGGASLNAAIVNAFLGLNINATLFADSTAAIETHLSPDQTSFYAIVKASVTLNERITGRLSGDVLQPIGWYTPSGGPATSNNNFIRVRPVRVS